MVNVEFKAETYTFNPIQRPTNPQQQLKTKHSKLATIGAVCHMHKLPADERNNECRSSLPYPRHRFPMKCEDFVKVLSGRGKRLLAVHHQPHELREVIH